MRPECLKLLWKTKFSPSETECNPNPEYRTEFLIKCKFFPLEEDKGPHSPSADMFIVCSTDCNLLILRRESGHIPESLPNPGRLGSAVRCRKPAFGTAA